MDLEQRRFGSLIYGPLVVWIPRAGHPDRCEHKVFTQKYVSSLLTYTTKEFVMSEGTSASYRYSDWKIDTKFELTLNLAKYGSLQKISNATQGELSARRAPKEGMLRWLFRPWKSEVKNALKLDIRNLLETFRNRTTGERPGSSEEFVEAMAMRLLAAASPSGRIPTKKRDVDELIVRFYQDGWFSQKDETRETILKNNSATLLKSIEDIAGQSKLISRQELMHAVHVVADKEAKSNAISNKKILRKTCHFRLSDDNWNGLKWSFSDRSLNLIVKNKVVQKTADLLIKQKVRQFLWKVAAEADAKTVAALYKPKEGQLLEGRKALLAEVLDEAKDYKADYAGGTEAISLADTEFRGLGFAESFQISADDVDIIEKEGLLRRVALTPSLAETTNWDAIERVLGRDVANVLVRHEATMTKLVLDDPDPEALLEDLKKEDIQAWLSLAVACGKEAGVWTNGTSLEKAGLKEAFDILLKDRTKECLDAQDTILSVRETATPSVSIIEVRSDIEIEWHPKRKDPRDDLPELGSEPIASDLHDDEVIALLPGMAVPMKRRVVEAYRNDLSQSMETGEGIRLFPKDADPNRRLIIKRHVTTPNTLVVLPLGEHILRYHRGQDEHRTIGAMMSCLKEIGEWETDLFKYELDPDSGNANLVSDSGMPVSPQMRDKYEWIVEGGEGMGGLLLALTKGEDLIDRWVKEQLDDDAGYLTRDTAGKVCARPNKHADDAVRALARYVLEGLLESDDADPERIMSIALYLERHKVKQELTVVFIDMNMRRQAIAALDKLHDQRWALRDFTWAFPQGEFSRFFRESMEGKLRSNGVDMNFDAFYQAMRDEIPDLPSDLNHLTEKAVRTLMSRAHAAARREGHSQLSQSSDSSTGLSGVI